MALNNTFSERQTQPRAFYALIPMESVEGQEYGTRVSFLKSHAIVTYEIDRFPVGILEANVDYGLFGDQRIFQRICEQVQK